MPTGSSLVLLATEFCDFLCTLYNVTPLNLQIHCNGCGTALEVRNTLSCSKGGLVIALHNEVREDLLYLAQQAFTLVSVFSEPRIHQGCTISEREICQGSDKEKKTRGDIMIQGLWY